MLLSAAFTMGFAGATLMGVSCQEQYFAHVTDLGFTRWAEFYLESPHQVVQEKWDQSGHFIQMKADNQVESWTEGSNTITIASPSPDRWDQSTEGYAFYAKLSSFVAGEKLHGIFPFRAEYDSGGFPSFVEVLHTDGITPMFRTYFWDFEDVNGRRLPRRGVKQGWPKEENGTTVETLASLELLDAGCADEITPVVKLTELLPRSFTAVTWKGNASVIAAVADLNPNAPEVAEFHSFAESISSIAQSEFWLRSNHVPPSTSEGELGPTRAK